MIFFTAKAQRREGPQRKAKYLLHFTWEGADLLQILHSGARRNPTTGSAKPEKSTNWIPTFAGATNTSVFPRLSFAFFAPLRLRGEIFFVAPPQCPR